MNLVQTGHRKQAGPADGELMTELSDLCEGGYPQQMFACPFSFSPPTDHLWNHGSDTCCPSAPVQLLSQPSPKSFPPWASGSPPSCHSDPHLPGSCFYQLHTRAGPFAPEGVDFGAGVGGTVSPCGLQVEWQSASPPSPAVLQSHFQAFGSLLHPPPVQHPRSFTQ